MARNEEVSAALRKITSDTSAKGIGNYVHFHAQNYLNFGITYDDLDKGVSASAALQNSHAELQRIINSKYHNGNWGKYSSFLNKTVYPKNNNLYKTPTLPAQDMNVIYDWINETLSKNHNQIVDNARALITDPDINSSRSYIYKNNARKNKNTNDSIYTKSIQLRTLLKLTKEVFKSYKKAIEIKQNTTSVEVIKLAEEAENNAKIVGKELENFLLELTNAKTLNGISNTNFYKNNKYKSAGIIRTDNSNREMDTELGKMIMRANEAIRMLQDPTSQISGDAGEYLVAAATEALAATGKKTINTILNDFGKNAQVIGNQGTRQELIGFSSIVSLDKIVEDIGVAFGKPLYEKIDNMIISSGATKDTVDVIVNIQDNKNLANELGVNEFGTSIKNYATLDPTYRNPSGGVSLLSSAPLLSILMLFNTDFVNHYLNLMGAHQPPAIKQSPEAESYKNELLWGIAVRAVSGIRGLSANMSKKFSDVLIINDKSTQHIYVISTSDLLYGIYGNINSYFDISIGAKNGNGLIYLWNRWNGKNPSQDGAFNRIQSVINELHNFKVHASLLKNGIQHFESKPVSWI